MRNKRGAVFTLTAGIVAILAGLALAVIIAALIFTAIKWTLVVGGGGLVLTFIYGVFPAMRGELSKRKTVFLLFLFLFFGVITLLPYIGFVQQTALGFTTLSISNVEVIDDGARIRVYGVATGAENLQIDFNSDRITQYILDDGYKATQSITGTIKLTKQTKRFMLDKQTDELFKRLRAENIGIFTTCSTNACSAESPTGYVHNGARFRSSTLGCVCLYERGEGINSIFVGRSILDSKVDFNIGGATGSLEPSRGNNVLILNDGSTEIEWTGDLSNFEEITYPQYSVLFKESVYNRLISRNAWSNYKDAVNNLGQCTEVGPNFFSNLNVPGAQLLFSLPSVTQINSCVDTFNNELNTVLASKNLQYIASIDAASLSFSQNSMDVELKTADKFPTFIITLDASKVGIVELKGKPDIFSCAGDAKINSGDTDFLPLAVKNIGESSGSFSGSVECGDIASGTIGERFFEVGETATMSVQITGTNNEEGIKTTSCTYTITDRKSQRSDSCSSQISVEYQSGIVCDLGTSKCLDDGKLRVCSEDGKSFDDIECDNKCVVLESGEGVCAGGSCLVDIDCSEGEFCVDEVCVVQPIVCGVLEESYIGEDCGRLSWKKLPLINKFTRCTYLPKCKVSSWVWITGFGVLFSIIIVMLLLPKGNKRKVNKRRKK